MNDQEIETEIQAKGLNRRVDQMRVAGVTSTTISALNRRLMCMDSTGDTGCVHRAGC